MFYTDQLQHTIELTQTPKRIVSLIPSQSEYLWDLGLREELVGISKFCIHPKEMFETVTRVGGTKQLDLDKIKQLKPDLIIGNKEENVKEQIEELQNYFPVWMSDVNTLEEAYDMMLNLGEITGKAQQSIELVEQIKRDLSSVKDLFNKKKVAYFIWSKPYMVVAKETYIDSVLQFCGLTNVFAEHSRYPEVTLSDLKQAAPDLCFLSSEPFPFHTEHLNEIQSQLPQTKVVLVDGEMFSWYGSHLLYLAPYLAQLKKEIGG
jgi:ABC-type Fe3+-hydroxamate transport system substrate-binding protein